MEIKDYINKELQFLEHNYLILVSDKDDLKIKENFNKFLKEEEFSRIYNGLWNYPWWLIDINKKVYFQGRPGVEYTKPICNTKVSINDFKTIYNIFKNSEKLK